MEIMNNPVKLGCDHSFGKEALKKWFAEGKNTCPLDQGVVDEDAITYDDELRSKVEEYVKEHPEILEEGKLKAVDKDLSKIKASLIHSHDLIAKQVFEALERDHQARAIGRLNEVIVRRIAVQNDIRAREDHVMDQRCGCYATCFAIFMVALVLLSKIEQD
jgi:hypothetical protein